MSAVIFCGIQGAGKSTFYRERFAETHVRLGLDLLRTRNREDILLHACLAAQQPFVVDNTNPTAASRMRYARLGEAAGFTTVLYYFECDVTLALQRNAGRARRVPDVAILGTRAKLELPTRDEGFDQMYHVRVREGTFEVEEWNDEIQ